MKIDILHALYTVSMIILAFTAALVVTKTLTKYLGKREESSKEEE
jgi:uncharacterized phage infection (PIP) family protein YhgE